MPAAEQFGQWNAVVGEAFASVRVERAGDEGPFPSTIAAQEMAGIGVSRIASEAQSVTREPSHIERAAAPVWFLNLPLSPGSSASQAGRSARLRSGDFVLVDGSRPFRLDFERRFDQVSLTLPHELLNPLLARPDQAGGVRVRGDWGVGGVASGAIQALGAAAETIDRGARRGVRDDVVHLVASALNQVAPDSARGSAAPLTRAALEEIERSLGDPQLSPAVVADRVGVSTRYLHQLISARGPSFGRWVLQRRLEACRGDLLDPARADWSITEIALSRGFRDASHMTRAFGERFGVTPSAMRAAGPS